MTVKFLRNTLLAALGAAFACLVWAVAPALSTQPYVPAAADFTQALPEARQVAGPAELARAARERDSEHAHHEGHDDHGPVLYRTPPVSAPHRFDLVGVEGEMSALEFRAREDGESWSDWVVVDSGDPVYTGGTDEVQVRSRGVPIEGRLHYVNVSGDTTAGGGLLTSMRSSVNSAVISLFGAEEATAASPKPQFIKRREWGADQPQGGGCHPREDPEFGKVKAGVIHHTVSTNTYTEAEAPSVVLGICRFHRNSNGWNDIGYNALVDRFGNLYEGRAGGLNRPVVGAQVEGFNSQTAGIATIADHRTKLATPAEVASLVNYLSWRLSLVGLDAAGTSRLLSAGGSSNQTPEGRRITVKQILGHGDLGLTECPGEALRARVGRIRRAVQQQIAADGGVVDPVDPVEPGGGSAPR